MSPFQLALPVLGILAILALVWLTGGLKTARIADAAAARARLAQDQPQFQPAAVALSRDGKLALLTERDGGQLALVFATGSRLATRVLKPGNLRAAALDRTGTITLATDDFGRREFRLELADAATAADWAQKLEAFRTQAPHPDPLPPRRLDPARTDGGRRVQPPVQGEGEKHPRPLAGEGGPHRGAVGG